MRMTARDLSEAVASWIDSTGFDDEISAITAAINDCDEAFEKVYQNLFPRLVRVDPEDEDEALDVIIDLLVELEHIGRHMFDAAAQLNELRKHVDGENQTQN